MEFVISNCWTDYISPLSVVGSLVKLTLFLHVCILLLTVLSLFCLKYMFEHKLCRGQQSSTEDYLLEFVWKEAVPVDLMFPVNKY